MPLTHATCLPHHPSSVIYSSYHTLLCKLWNCSRFIINHVLMAIPPTDNAKHFMIFFMKGQQKVDIIIIIIIIIIYNIYIVHYLITLST
jgi:hypothetical protein